MGGQHLGMDRAGVGQVPVGSGEQGKKKKKEETKEKTGCKIICGAPTTLAVKELVMMMIMIKHFSEPSIFLDKNLIKVVTKAKFLNVVFDRTLSYNSHVNYLKRNCLKARDIKKKRKEKKVIRHTNWRQLGKLLCLYRTLV